MEAGKFEYFIKTENAAKFSPADGVETKVLSGLNGEKMMMTLTTIQPGAEVPSHSHPHEQVGMVRQGKAIMEIDGDERTITIGDIVVIPPNVSHSARCSGNEPFAMLDVFSPIREDFAEKAKK